MCGFTVCFHAAVGSCGLREARPCFQVKRYWREWVPGCACWEWGGVRGLCGGTGGDTRLVDGVLRMGWEKQCFCAVGFALGAVDSCTYVSRGAV